MSCAMVKVAALDELRSFILLARIVVVKPMRPEAQCESADNTLNQF
jgi:hypothetical protein